MIIIFCFFFLFRSVAVDNECCTLMGRVNDEATGNLYASFVSSNSTESKYNFFSFLLNKVVMAVVKLFLLFVRLLFIIIIIILDAFLRVY